MSAPTSGGPHGQKLSPIHTFLPEGRIRLFELDLRPGKDVAGTLHTVKIGSGGAPYFALSYVCGTGANNRKISVDGETFKVKSNLYDALTTLRTFFQGEKTSKALLWIDAICIDQSDEQEKARQIRNMHDVFSGAQEVLVCLGNVSDDVNLFLHVLAWDELFADLKTRLAPEHLKRLQDSMGTQGEDMPSSERVKRWTARRLAWLINPSTLLAGLEQHHRSAEKDLWSNYVNQETAERIALILGVSMWLRNYHGVAYQNLYAMHVFLEKLDAANIASLYTKKEELQTIVEAILTTHGLRDDLFRLDHRFWSAIHAFIRHEWFQRVWTFQEALLAKKAQFFAGEVRVTWRNIVRHTLSLLTVVTADNLLKTLDSTVQGIQAVEQPIETAGHVVTWMLYAQDEIHVSLTYLFMVTSNRRATVVKDNVYALLALLDSGESDLITIDYSKSDAEVLASAIKVALLFTSSNASSNGDMSIAYFWEYAGLWESSTETQPPVENLPSWCPELRGNVDLVPLTIGGEGMVVWEPFPLDVTKKSAPYARYDHRSGFDTIGLTVLKLDKIKQCMNTVCPLSIHDWYQTSMRKSEKKTYAKRVPAQIKWLRDLQSTFPPKFGDSGSVSRLLEEYLYGTKKHKLQTIGLIDDFSASLTILLGVATGARSASEEEMLIIGEVFVILISQRHRYLFETATGRIGYCARPPELGSQLIVVPRASLLHMLSADSNKYVGCAAISGMMNDTMLDVLDERKSDWGMVYLK